MEGFPETRIIGYKIYQNLPPFSASRSNSGCFDLNYVLNIIILAW